MVMSETKMISFIIATIFYAFVALKNESFLNTLKESDSVAWLQP